MKSEERDAWHDLQAFNRTVQRHDTLDGANCLTVGKRHLSQREAAMEAVQKIGLNQIAPVEDVVFAEREDWKKVYYCRIETMINKQEMKGCRTNGFELDIVL